MSEHNLVIDRLKRIAEIKYKIETHELEIIELQNGLNMWKKILVELEKKEKELI